MGAFERITAAASRIITRGKGSSGAATGKGTLAWDMWETVPEVQAYAGWIGNAMSGATLYAGRRGPDGTIEPAPEGSRAAELVASIAGGIDGQGPMLGAFGTHLAVAGESWLVIVPDPEADSFADDGWHVLSTEEVKTQRGKIKATVEGEEIEIVEDADGADDPVAIRIWQPSPRRHIEATSPVFASLGILEELRLMTAAVAALARSRITGRGVLLVPSGTRFPSTPGQEGSEDSLLDTLIEVASTAIREPESAAATVPIVLEVPGDLITGVKWLQFNSEVDALLLQLREEAIRRFAAGADVPAEVLLGMGDINHWGAWALQAEALRMGAEPRLSLVCNALTDQWLRPLLQAENDPEADEWMVWYDTSGLRSSSNKGASSLEAYKLGLINSEAARRELGFTEADAPDAGSLATATRERNDLPVNDIQNAPAADSVALAATGLFTGPKDDESWVGLDGYGALVAAVDGIVWAALTAAGHRLRQTPAVPRPARGAARELAAARVHTRHPVTELSQLTSWRLLDGAWDRVPEVAARYGINPQVLSEALDGYVTGLLVYGQPHEFDNVPRLLTQMRIAGELGRPVFEGNPAA